MAEKKLRVVLLRVAAYDVDLSCYPESDGKPADEAAKIAVELELQQEPQDLAETFAFISNTPEEAGAGGVFYQVVEVVDNDAAPPTDADAMKYLKNVAYGNLPARNVRIEPSEADIPTEPLQIPPVPDYRETNLERCEPHIDAILDELPERDVRETAEDKFGD